MVRLTEFLKVASRAGFRSAMMKRTPRELKATIDRFMTKADPSKKIYVSTPGVGDSVRSAHKQWAKTMQTISPEEQQALSSMRAAFQAKGFGLGGNLSTKVRNLPR